MFSTNQRAGDRTDDFYSLSSACMAESVKDRGRAGTHGGTLKSKKELAVGGASWLVQQLWSRLTKPHRERYLDRILERHRPQKILEVGIADLEQTARILRSAPHWAGATASSSIHYVAIDLFDLRPMTQPKLSLKHVHCQLHPIVGSLRLIPGDPFEALTRMANSLGPFDLCLVHRTVDPLSLERAWYFFPRMLAPRVVTLIEDDDPPYRECLLSVIEARARQSAPRRRAA
jgi:hypothetical protein